MNYWGDMRTDPMNYCPERGEYPHAACTVKLSCRWAVPEATSTGSATGTRRSGTSSRAAPRGTSCQRSTNCRVRATRWPPWT